MSTTIRVSKATRDRFAELSAATGRPMTELLDDAADALERKLFLDEFDAGFARLRASEIEWKEVLHERQLESGVLADQA